MSSPYRHSARPPEPSPEEVREVVARAERLAALGEAIQAAGAVEPADDLPGWHILAVLLAEAYVKEADAGVQRLKAADRLKKDGGLQTPAIVVLKAGTVIIDRGDDDDLTCSFASETISVR